MASHKHLTLMERIQIQYLLEEKKSFACIGKRLDKDPSTIKKEVLKHRTESTKVSPERFHNDCIHRRQCKSPKFCERCPNTSRRCGRCDRCNTYCDRFEKEICVRTEKPPYVCNGCSDKYRCTLIKLIYDGQNAHETYRSLLSESRQGISISKEELESIGALLHDKVKEKHQSIHHIMIYNSDCFNICEKTLYNYIDSNLFDTRNIDLSRKVPNDTKKMSCASQSGQKLYKRQKL